VIPKITLVLDIECYPNYFLVMFRRVDTGRTRAYEMYEGHPLNRAEIEQVMQQYRVVTFNGMNYDCPLLAYALRKNPTCQMLKAASDSIITANLRGWQFEQLHDIKVPREWDHIDLSEVAPGVMISLKQYGARMHSKRLQDLPIKHDTHISPAQRQQLIEYCGNDLQTTIDLWRTLTTGADDVIAIREEVGKTVGMDMRSKSDAQMAEAIIRKAVEDRKGFRIQKPSVPVGKTFKYTPPAFIRFHSEKGIAHADNIAASTFTVKANGKISEPPLLRKSTDPVLIAGRGYKMGIGGLHSTEKSVSHWADDDIQLCDVDVVSFYPELIRKCGLAPENMGADFSSVYGGYIDRRIAAKHAGRKTEAQTFKIALNGTFGKLGSPYSVLYAPHLLIQVTVTGQLMLLMMIERMESAGIHVVSANTDGIVLKYPRQLEQTRIEIVQQWEHEADFKTEETRYRALCSKDVNNYIALKVGGGAKTKGEYAPYGLMKNPENQICNDAVIALLEHGTPIEQTVYGCQDVRKFITAMKATGGATFDGQYLGKVVRWVYRKGETRDIRYVKANEGTGNHNKVSSSDGAMPLMDLPDELPHDLDHARYIRKAYSILDDIGVVGDVRTRLLVGGRNADLFY